MAALGANNALGKAQKQQQAGMQKLYTGLKINSAKDDASGLAITEKMKNQIKALDTAKDNCEDGANLIQTAEGSIGEIHDILTRMTELAEKAANGTLEDTDRGKLQKEMDQLSGEIDRIATTANFNGQKLLDGSLGSNGYVKLEVTDKIAYDSAGDATTLTADITATGANQHGAAQYVKATFDTLGGSSGISIDTSNAVTGANGMIMNSSNAIGDAVDDLSTRGIKLQIGESSTMADKLEVKINSFHTDSLFAGIAGFKNSTVNGTDKADDAAVGAIKMNTDVSTYNQAISIDISDMDHASAAADAIRQVSNYVSDERGKLGAQQNRLEHTVNNLTTASENTTAAKSRILDTDMAKEMMEYTSKNVIAQAAQSMLAQANSQPQNVLSLLQ
jgi:flagellin